MTTPAKSRRRPSVFISFSSAELAAAEALANALESSDVPTFFAPRDIHGGMNFAVEIVKAVAACDVVVVLLSPTSIKSPHVRREVSLAIDERRTLLPLAMPGTTYPTDFSTEWTYWLSAVQVMDYLGPDAAAGQIERMLPSVDTGGIPIERGATTHSPRRPPRPPRRRVGGTGSPSGLLRADRQDIAIEGREGELTRLEQWCLRDDDFDTRILTGAAGQGKTRLAHELMRLVGQQGWDTGLVPAGVSGTDEILRLKGNPTLIVVDYAETRGQQLANLFDALLEHGIHDKVRVLLIARTSSDWWKALLARSDALAGLLADVTVQPLAPITGDRDLVDRIYVSACQRFSAELGVSPPGAVVAPLRQFGSVLEILEGALARVLGAAPETGAGTDRLLAHERRYIAAAASADNIPDIDAVDLNRIAAGLTLFGADTEDEATAVIEDCNSDLTPLVRRRIARLFRRLYPGSSSYIEGIRPDALAEDLIADVMADDGRLPGTAIDRNGDKRSRTQSRRALTTLSRGATRHIGLAPVVDSLIQSGSEAFIRMAMDVATQLEQPEVVTKSIADAVAMRPELDAFTLLTNIPDETVALADLAAQLARRVIAGLPEPEVMDATDVQLEMDCSNRFSDAGWSFDAAGAAQLAVDRLLGSALDVNGQRQLGRALTNLSNRLWEIGRIGVSLEPARQSVEYMISAGSPVGELAAARSNLAFRMSELGHVDAAVAQALEAERLCRSSDFGSSSDIDKTLGSALNNLACVMLAGGDSDRALKYATACVDLRRSQALTNRDRYLPYVARALANAASAAEVSGDRARADRLIIEARSLHELTGPQAPIFRFEQAESATIHAIILLSRSDWNEACTIANDARDMLGSIDADLGGLTVRLSATQAWIQASAEAKQSPEIGGPQCKLPQLLEYRDL
ncbi:TIR domain-containing protein [Nocardia sp. CA-135953]|uniref:TIR domain-containing protein n=1 Tax=Nocardia sp. CA-135953 TaxID=3239978 RepID=UPI003D957A94